MVRNGDNRVKSNNETPVGYLLSTDLSLTEKTWKSAIDYNSPVLPKRPGFGNIGAKHDVSVKGFRRYNKTELPYVEVASTKNLKVDKYVSERLKLKDLSSVLSDANRVEVQKALEGIKVETDHLSYKRRYKVIGVSTESADQLKFSIGNVRYSVSEYFKDKYKIELEHPALPCIQVGRSDKLIYLPMEVCTIVQSHEYLKALNQKLVTALISRTCNLLAPVEDTNKKNKKLNGHASQEHAGINTSEECELVNARVLPTPMLKYHDSGIEREFVPKQGHWNMGKKKMYEAATVDQWTCLSFSDVDKQTLENFCNELVAMCSSMGMTLSHPSEIICSADPNQLEETLLKVCSPTENNLPLQLLIIILPEVPDLYGEIKRICETKIGIVSQCCKSRNLIKISEQDKNSKQYLQNLALKINVKVGGSNTVLFDAIQRHIPLLTDRPTIVIGADVTHPPPAEDSSASIAAVVASMDWPAVSKYRGLVHAQDHHVEIMHLHDCVRDLLRAFCSTNGERKPERIIFFRDGVSESQFAEVMLKEVDMIWQACKSIGENYEPQVTFVAVQKGHNTRFLPVDDKMVEKKRDTIPGTVVDTKICHPTEFNFYLCSHVAGIQKKSRPTLYHVLYDENNFTADLLQLLINSLCYTSARCTRAISVVPPAYYARLLAYRARAYVEAMKLPNGDVGSTGVKDNMTKEKQAAIQTLPEIMDNVKNVMFYC